MADDFTLYSTREDPTPNSCDLLEDGGASVLQPALEDADRGDHRSHTYFHIAFGATAGGFLLAGLWRHLTPRGGQSVLEDGPAARAAQAADSAQGADLQGREQLALEHFDRAGERFSEAESFYREAAAAWGLVENSGALQTAQTERAEAASRAARSAFFAAGERVISEWEDAPAPPVPQSKSGFVPTDREEWRQNFKDRRLKVALLEARPFYEKAGALADFAAELLRVGRRFLNPKDLNHYETAQDLFTRAANLAEEFVLEDGVRGALAREVSAEARTALARPHNGSAPDARAQSAEALAIRLLMHHGGTEGFWEGETGHALAERSMALAHARIQEAEGRLEKAWTPSAVGELNNAYLDLSAAYSRLGHPRYAYQALRHLEARLAESADVMGSPQVVGHIRNILLPPLRTTLSEWNPAHTEMAALWEARELPNSSFGEWRAQVMEWGSPVLQGVSALPPWQAELVLEDLIPLFEVAGAPVQALEARYALAVEVYRHELSSGGTPHPGLSDRLRDVAIDAEEAAGRGFLSPAERTRVYGMAAEAWEALGIAREADRPHAFAQARRVLNIAIARAESGEKPALIRALARVGGEISPEPLRANNEVAGALETARVDRAIPASDSPVRTPVSREALSVQKFVRGFREWVGDRELALRLGLNVGEVRALGEDALQVRLEAAAEGRLGDRFRDVMGQVQRANGGRLPREIRVIANWVVLTHAPNGPIAAKQVLHGLRAFQSTFSREQLRDATSAWFTRDAFNRLLRLEGALF